MGEIVAVKPRVHADVPAFVAGALFAYEDLLGAFPAVVVARPGVAGPPLNTVAVTSERIIAFDTHGATEATVAIPLPTVTAISTAEDAAQGRVTCVGRRAELDVAELDPDDARFLQDVIFHAAAGRLYRARPPIGD